MWITGRLVWLPVIGSHAVSREQADAGSFERYLGREEWGTIKGIRDLRVCALSGEQWNCWRVVPSLRIHHEIGLCKFIMDLVYAFGISSVRRISCNGRIICGDSQMGVEGDGHSHLEDLLGNL